jgi:outer membrane biosynthesis protein TonB
MTHRKGAIWTERLLLTLILISLAATLNLLLAIHRQSPAEKTASTEDVAAPALAESRERPEAPPAEPAAPEGPAVAEKPAPPPPPDPPVEDPTKKAIASLTTATEKETKAAEEADRRASALEKGYRSAVAESDRWKRREMLVRQQIAGITADAVKLEREADELDAERDVLERELDATKAALAKASTRAGFAVLPYKGPNGTWRRPIVVECTGGGAKLQPRGPSFTGLELSPRIHPRSSEFVKAIARELFHIRSADTPDGTPAVPYIVFLVRPDGIGAYYLARTSLEPLGIAFGYELIDQKLAVNIPDFDDLTTWDGTVPLEMPLEPAPGSTSNRLARGGQEERQNRSDLVGSMRGDQSSMIGSLPGAEPRSRQREQGGSGAQAPEPDDFVWPGRGRGSGRGGDQGSQPALASTGSETEVQGAGGNGKDGGARGMNPLPGHELARPEDVGSSGGRGGSDEARTGGSADGNVGAFAAAGAGGQGSGNRPAGFGSGMTGNAVNAEDVGAGVAAEGGGEGDGARVGARAGAGASSGADPADQPFSSGAPGTGGAGVGRRVPGGRSDGTDTVFSLPNFEPAADPGGGSPSAAPTGLPSGGGRARGQQPGQASIFSVAGEQAPATAGPGQTIEGPTKTASSARVGKSGQTQGFDWNAAAQDRSPSGGADALGSDPGLAVQPADDDAAPQGTTANAENLAPGRAFNRSSPAAPGQTGSQANAYPSGTYSQEDVDRAKALAGTLSPEDLDRAKALAGTYSQEDVDRAKALSGLSSLVSPSLVQKLVGSSTSNGSASGMPASASSSNSGSSSQSGGMPLGDNSQSSMSSSASSSASFGQFGIPNSNASSDDANELKLPPRKKDAEPEHAIDARFEIVVVCRKDEVLLHPGAYRLTGDVLRSRGAGPDSMLAREIRAMVRNRAIVDPLIHQKPAIRFLVESQGAETFALARRQLLFALPDWPVSLQVAGSQDANILSRNRW